MPFAQQIRLRCGSPRRSYSRHSITFCSTCFQSLDSNTPTTHARYKRNGREGHERLYDTVQYFFTTATRQHISWTDPSPSCPWKNVRSWSENESTSPSTGTDCQRHQRKRAPQGSFPPLQIQRPKKSQTRRACSLAATSRRRCCTRRVRFGHDARYVRFAACRPVPGHLSRYRVPVVHLPMSRCCFPFGEKQHGWSIYCLLQS